MSKQKRFVLFCTLSAFLPACFLFNTNPVLIEVGHESVTKKEYLLMRGPVSKDEESSEEVKNEVLDSLVEEKLLLSQAKKDHVIVTDKESDDYIKSYLDELPGEALAKRLKAANIDIGLWKQRQEEKLLISKWLRIQIKKQGGIGETEMRNYYSAHLAELYKPMQVRARHIMVSSQKKAEELRTRILNGENFTLLARQYSESPDAELGGDLGYIQEGTHPKFFEDTCFALEVGDLSPVIRSGYGYHLFKVIDKQKEHIPTYDNLKDLLEKRVYEEKVKALRLKELQTIRDTVSIVRHEGEIKSLR